VTPSTLRKFSCIVLAILAMTGRVTMLGISRWTEPGGSYRSVQRFFNTAVDWSQVHWLLIKTHLLQAQATYILAGDELDRFFRRYLANRSLGWPSSRPPWSTSSSGRPIRCACRDRQLGIARNGPAASLSWSNQPDVQSYDPWRGLTPYFDPNVAEVPVATVNADNVSVGASITVNDAGTSPPPPKPITIIGDPAQNYFWVVRSGNDVSPNTNRTGEFDFQLVPGS
jgi:hypothetical protein